jgi:hypothetical protein
MQTNSSTERVSDRGPRGGARIRRVAETDWVGGAPACETDEVVDDADVELEEDES